MNDCFYRNFGITPKKGLLKVTLRLGQLAITLIGYESIKVFEIKEGNFGATFAFAICVPLNGEDAKAPHFQIF